MPFLRNSTNFKKQVFLPVIYISNQSNFACSNQKETLKFRQSQFYTMKTLYLTRHQQIDINEIMYLESESNYTVIHTSDEHKTIASQTLNTVHSNINYERFIRVNRSNILNIEYVSTFGLENNKLIVKLENGQQFVASRRRIKNCLDALALVQKRFDNRVF